jgi:hypothetical protein
MLKTSKLIWILSIMAILLMLVGCGGSGGGGIQFQAPIKQTPPPPTTQQQSFTVAANQANTVFISANSGERLTGSFTIQGGSGNDVNFSVKDLSGNTVLNGGRVSNSCQFDFVCASTGSYQIQFSNTFSIMSSKAVNLTTVVYHNN